jgi:hypothetical protein
MKTHEMIDRAKWHMRRALAIKDTARWDESSRQFVGESPVGRHHARCFVMLCDLARKRPEGWVEDDDEGD